MTSRRKIALLALVLLASDAAAKKQRTTKDWAKMSDADWDRIESEWETDEEKAEYEYKPPTQRGIDMSKLSDPKLKKNPKKMQEMIAESQVSSGASMMFATVDYPGCCVKKKTEEIAGRWSSLLASTGQDAKPYVIEDNQILFATQLGFHAHEIKTFALQQPETVAVEWNQHRTPGPAETPEWKAKNEAAKAASAAAKAQAAEAKKKAEEAEAKRKAKAKAAKRKKKKAAADGDKVEL